MSSPEYELSLREREVTALESIAITLHKMQSEKEVAAVEADKDRLNRSQTYTQAVKVVAYLADGRMVVLKDRNGPVGPVKP